MDLNCLAELRLSFMCMVKQKPSQATFRVSSDVAFRPALLSLSDLPVITPSPSSTQMCLRNLVFQNVLHIGNVILLQPGRTETVDRKPIIGINRNAEYFLVYSEYLDPDNPISSNPHPIVAHYYGVHPHRYYGVLHFFLTSSYQFLIVINFQILIVIISSIHNRFQIPSELRGGLLCFVQRDFKLLPVSSFRGQKVLL